NDTASFRVRYQQQTTLTGLTKDNIAMLFVRMFGVMEINVERVIEDGLSLLERDVVLLQIGPGLFFIPLKTHESSNPFLNPLPGEFGRCVALDFLAVADECSAVFDAGGGLARAPDGGVVEAAAGVRANLAQLAEALQAASEADGAARHVVPADGVFEHAEAGAVGDEEQLHVEAEAVNQRALDDRAAHVHAEGFEAALRVLEGQARHQA